MISDKTDSKCDNKWASYFPATVPDFNSKRPSGFDVAMRILLAFMFAVFIMTMVNHFVFGHVVVHGSSMNDTYQDGAYLTMVRLGEIKRYDVIVFDVPRANDVYFIKRVVGVPGDKVQIKDGYLYINGIKREDDIYGKELMQKPGLAGEPVYLYDNEYFVLGDNRNESNDSRFPEVGIVKRDKIIGKVL